MARGYYDDEDDGARRWLKVAVIGLIGASVAGGGAWMLTREQPSQPDLLTAVPVTTAATTDVATPTTPAPSSVAAPTSADSAPATAPATTAPATTAPTTTIAPTTTTAPTTSEGAADEPSGTFASAQLPETPAAASAASAATATPAPPEPTTSTAPAEPAADPSYPTNDDGTPLPVIVTYDTDVITITGFVPSQAAKDRLGMLAQANSKTDARLENNLIINENVPIGVGVRVIELNSARFPEGSAEILPAHATELARVVTVMDALPNVTMLVIGHADQRGDEETNYAISAKRAVAVVNFLTFLGVSPTRMSSRAVGEADLLTLEDDGTALALNRRTEFIFYGVLVD